MTLPQVLKPSVVQSNQWASPCTQEKRYFPSHQVLPAQPPDIFGAQ